MLIRDEQMGIHRQVVANTFENRMVEHLRDFAPNLSESAGEPGVRTAVREGIERAKKYGFNNVGPVRLYLELLFTFGSDFDSDPQLPWAAEILTQLSPTDQMSRADRLYEKTTEYLDCVAGPKRVYARDALRNMADVGADALASAPKLLETLSPKKYEYSGAQAFEILEREAILTASLCLIPGQNGNGVILFLMFAFGHGIATDPLYPWVGATLGEPSLADPDQRARRLYEKMQSYIRGMLNPVADKETGRG